MANCYVKYFGICKVKLDTLYEAASIGFPARHDLGMRTLNFRNRSRENVIYIDPL